MKKALLILFIITTQNINSQVSFYFPLSTTHFENHAHFKDDQGGNRGVIVGYELEKIVLSLGLYENSYGLNSKIITLGYRFDYKKVQLIPTIGLADNYPKYFAYGSSKFWGRTNQAMIGLNVRKQIYKSIGVQVNFTPAIVNYGIYLDL